MHSQERLLYITKLRVEELNTQKIRGVTAFWKDMTACISFYFDGKITDEDLDKASDACAEIIAQFSNGLLEEHYIQWDHPKQLPKKNLAYIRPEEGDVHLFGQIS